MTGMGHNSKTDAAISDYIQRVLRLEAEIRDINQDKTAIYNEAKKDHIEVPCLKAAVAKIRKREGREISVDAADETTGRYLAAFYASEASDAQPKAQQAPRASVGPAKGIVSESTATRGRAPAPARPLPAHNPDTGEIIESGSAETPRGDGVLHPTKQETGDGDRAAEPETAVPLTPKSPEPTGNQDTGAGHHLAQAMPAPVSPNDAGELPAFMDRNRRAA